jgi:hypothetical protein
VATLEQLSTALINADAAGDADAARALAAEISKMKAAPAAKPDTFDAADMAKSGGVGVAKGGIQLAGIPGDARALASMATDKIGSAVGASPQTIGGIKDVAYRAALQTPFFAPFALGKTSDQLQQGVENVTGEFYKPKTTSGEYAQTVGEFLPAAGLGPGSVARRIGMQAVVPALGSELAGQQTKGTAYEPYARVAGALAAPVAASKAGPVLADVLGGIGTHTGGGSIKTAFSSGMKGGESGQAFRDNMRGNVPIDEVVTDAKTALQSMRGDRSTAYNKGMASMRADEAAPYPSAVLKFDEIDKAISGTNSVKNFKGKDLAPETADIRKQIGEVVDDWKSLNPNEYHTPLGMDALKQRLGSIKDSLPYGSPERVIADRAYNAARETIVKQAPDYAKTMKGYEAASKEIDEIQKTLSLNPKASVDTALRKLQSVTRNNVNTNYGKRADLAETLSQHGAPELMEKLSGQAMNAWTPRGLGKFAAPVVAGSSWFNPMAAAMLPLMSPRLVGEAAHGAGRVAGAVPKSEELIRALIGAGKPKAIDQKRAALISALNSMQGAHP